MPRSIFVASLVSLTAVAPSADVSAAPASEASAGGSVDTSAGASGRRSRRGFAPPERVIAGNALSVLLPFQIGAIGYLPRARLGIQYDRQLRKGHWLYLGAAALFDYGDWRAFRLDKCWPSIDASDPDPGGTCDRGAVAGFDVYLGYVFRWYIKEHSWIVPHIRLGIGFEWWRYPKLRSVEAREQERYRSWTLNLRPGGGARFFLRDDLGIGLDVNLPIGFLIHTQRPSGGSDGTDAGFLLGVEALIPLEYRF